MKGQKKISILILMFIGIWFFQYFLSYIQGAIPLLSILLGLFLWLSLLLTAIGQMIILLLEQRKHYRRLFFITIIIFANSISFINPQGIVDWESYEGENLLVAKREGTVGCQEIIKLRRGNRFKYSNICFGTQFLQGNYQLKEDTLWLEPDGNSKLMNRNAYGVFENNRNDKNRYDQLCFFRNEKERKCLSFSVREDRLIIVE